MRGSVKLGFAVLFFGGFALAVGLRGAGTVSDSSRAPASVAQEKIQVVPLADEDPLHEVVAYHFERKVHADLKAQTVKPLIDLSLQGTVFVTELSRTSNSRNLSLQFELVQGNETQVHASRLPFLLEVTDDQKVKGLKTVIAPEKSDEDDLNVLKDFVSLYAYGSNRDTSGNYQFSFKRTGNQIEKSKLKYEAVSGPSPQILSSKIRAEVELGTGIWIKGSGKEQTKVSGLGEKQSIVTLSSFKLERLSSKVKPKLVINTHLPVKEASLDLISVAELEPRSWVELKAELAMIRQMPRSKRLSLFHDLTKLLKSDPALVAEFKAYIESVSKETGLMTFGIGVLATAGSDAAQAALRDWYGGKYGQEHTILNAFSTADAQLNSDTREFLQTIVAKRSADADLAQNAVFALGSSLKHTDDEDTRKALLNYYSTSQSESDRLGALDAMGNSGDPKFLPALKQAIENGSAGERERAVFGARFLPAESAAPILRAAFQDENPAVRQASIRALLYQDHLAVHAQLIRECSSAGISACKPLLGRLTP